MLHVLLSFYHINEDSDRGMIFSWWEWNCKNSLHHFWREQSKSTQLLREREREREREST